MAESNITITVHFLKLLEWSSSVKRIASIVLFFCQFFFFTLFGIAQSHTVEGLTLPVDEVSAVDSKNTRITVQGRVFLVPREEVNNVIVRECLKDSSIVQKLSPGALVEFTEKSIEQKNVQFLESGLQAMLIHGRVTKDQWLEFFARTAQSLELFIALKQAVIHSQIWSSVPSAIRIALLFELGIRDSSWIDHANRATLVTLSREFHEFGEKSLTEIIRTKKFSRLSQVAHLYRELFGVEDPLFQQAKILAEHLERFKQALSTNNSSEVEITLLSLQRNDEQRKILYPYFVEEIHRVARERIDDGSNSQALALISLIDLSFRTPTTHALAKLCLERLSGQDVLILDQSAIKRFLLALIQFDPSLKELFEKKLAWQFRAALHAQDVLQAERVIEMLVTARPDPNQANDQIRIEYAGVLRDWGLIAESQRQLKSVQTGLPFVLRLDIFTSDQLGLSLFNFIALIVSGVLLTALLIVRYSAAITAARQQRAESAKARPFAGFQRVAEDEQDGFEAPVFRRMQKTSPEKAEYLRCLEVFGLEGDVSFKDIRHAYRTAVKTYHPDRQGEGKATDKFVDLNQTYERILELRVTLGLEEE